MRLGIIGEGVSEETFAREMVCPHLLSYGIYAFSRQIVTKRNAFQKDSKGGIPRYERVRKDILNLIGEDSELFITSMFDLYALPNDFPGFEKAQIIENPYSRVQLLEEFFAKDINSKRFLPYIQLHEFESLFFTDVAVVHETLSLNNPKSSVRELEKILVEESNPEFINDGPTSAPSKRIKNIYPDYQKSVDAVRILQRIGLPNIRKKCAHFDSWLLKLESLRNIK
jgi:Domain of unknown function (DUF4276)